MLQNIRDNAQGTIAKIIVFLIILTFAVFGTDAIIQSFYGEPEAAVVNGDSITQADFERLVERKRRQLFNQLGPEFDPAAIDQNALRRAALEEAIQRELLLQAADKAGVEISLAQVDSFILQWPAAQQDGKFDPDRYRGLLASMGLTPQGFRAELREELAVAQLQAGVSQSAFLTEPELLELLRLERQTRDFRFVKFSALDRADPGAVSDEELNAYYEAERESYRLPDRVVVDYIEINKEDLEGQVEVDEAQLEAAYQAQLQSFESQEQRKASHILIEVNDERSEEQATQRVREIRSEIEGGLDFSEAAKQYSEDLGTRIDGGDLGLLARGVLDDSALEDAVFGLQEGQISQPIRSAFGVHLVKLESIQKAQPPEKESTIERLRQEQRAAGAESRFVEISSELADLTYSAPDLAEAAEAMNVSVKTSPEFSAEGVGENGGIWRHPRVLEQAFSEDIRLDGHNSEVIEVSRDKLVVFRLNQFRPSEIPALADLEAKLRDTIALNKAREQIEKEVAAILDGTADQLNGLNWQSVIGAGRQGGEHPEITPLAFRMAGPAEGETTRQSFTVDDGIVLVELTRVSNPDPDSLKDLKGIVSPLVASRLGALEYEVFLKTLRDKAEIVRNP